MKKFSKLIPAFCMLLISAMLMGTSTFAWFSMNKTVTATGMQIQARAEGGIVIGRPSTSRDNAKSNVTVTLDSQKLLPTSTADGSTWYHAEAEKDNASTALTGTLTELTLTQTAPTAAGLGTKYPSGSTEQVYVLYDTVTVFPDKNSSSFTDLWVASCTVSGNTADLSKSIRVAFVCGDKVVICAPAYSTTTSYNVGTASTAVKALGTSATGTTPLAKAASGDDANILVADGTKTEVAGVSVNVYVYFEGEDTNHTTDNLGKTGAIEDLTISYSFKCTSVAAAN